MGKRGRDETSKNTSRACCQKVGREAGMTGRTGARLAETANGFFGKGMVLKSKKWQTFLTTCPSKAEQFTLNSRQRYHSMLARVPGKAHIRGTLSERQPREFTPHYLAEIQQEFACLCSRRGAKFSETRHDK